MRSLLAFWMGGAAAAPVVAATPAHSIYRLDQAATGGDLYRAASLTGSGSIYR